jgi:hypothetical protein
MLPLSPTEECMIRCYRKVYKFASDSWFWLWTTALIYGNKLREMMYNDSPDIVIPSIPVSSGDTYIIGQFARDNVVAATLVNLDGSEVDFDESYLTGHTDTPVTAGDIIQKSSTEDTSDSSGMRLTVIMLDGSTHTYTWDEQLIYKKTM